MADKDLNIIKAEIANLLLSPTIKQQIDMSVDRGADIGKTIRNVIESAIASKYPAMRVCFNEITISSAGEICAGFEILGELSPLKNFIIYDGQSSYDGNHHYHSIIDL